MKENNGQSRKYSVEDICFGLDRPTDERSFRMFVQRLAEDSVLDVIIPRLSEAELNETVHFLNGVLHRYLNKKEYHQLFLDERK